MRRWPIPPILLSVLLLASCGPTASPEPAAAEPQAWAIAIHGGAGSIADLSPDALDPYRASLDAATPVSQSLAGLYGTVITSLLVGAIAAIFLRKK